VRPIAVLDYDSGNLHSVSRALATAGGDVRVTSDPGEVADAAALVIPGVGHFGQCVRALRERGLDAAVKDFVGTGRLVFGVCVGMQVLFEASDEDPEPGLAVLPGRVHRLIGPVKVPHIGWNQVAWDHEHPYLDGIADDAWFYFVHSYAPHPIEPTPTLGTTEYGPLFTSAVSRDNVFATQFHPEKSGASGLRLYANFVRAVA
jgi:imidazole glycerol-phosphate synthase subunit HisH